MINLKGRLSSFLAVFFSLAIFLSLSYFRIFDEFEYSTLDLRYKIRPRQPVEKDIVIIHIGDDTIEKLGEWPIPRNYHALLINALSSAGVNTVIFDVFFSEHTDQDKEFAEAIKKAGNVYMAYVFEINLATSGGKFLEASRVIAPLIKPFAEACKYPGFINIKPDMDGKVRHVLTFLEYQGKFYPQITLLAALNNLGTSFEDVEVVPGKKIVVNDEITIPLGEESKSLVNFPARWGKAFRHYSYVEILQAYIAEMTGKEPAMDLSELKDTICFIGFTAAASPDAHPSPLEPLYPGVGVHASFYNSIMRDSFLMRVSRWWNLLILILMGLLTAVATHKSRKRLAFLSIGIILTGYAAATVLLFCFAGLWVDAFYPLVSIVGIYIIFTFRKYLIETKKREVLEKELDIAKNIQQSFLPREIPQVGNLEVKAKMLTARQVGGDLYDTVKIDDHKLGVMVGDVSGKGVPAALFMARVVSVFKEYAKEGLASEIIRNVNNNLCAENSSGLFVTLTYMIFDTEKHTLTFASGGHLPVVLVKPNGEVELLDAAEGMPLGLIEGDFSEETASFEPGSIFIFYTDGVTEAMNVKEEMYGEKRLTELARTFAGKDPEEVIQIVHAKVAEFAGKAPQHDDITVLAVKT